MTNIVFSVVDSCSLLHQIKCFVKYIKLKSVQSGVVVESAKLRELRDFVGCVVRVGV